ncbi:MAG: MoaD/ThiS family protein [Actinomycetota bacterium]|nr:MoaD/ThiS family protein [Actinomycetota bacterium]
MRVGIVCFGAMRAHLPQGSVGNRAEIDVADKASVSDVIESLGAPPALVFAVLVDGRQAPIDQRLQEGAEVTLMPPFAGGEGVPKKRDQRKDVISTT